MFGKVMGATVVGIEGILIQVEADISNGLPSFDMVGYLGAEVKEARERVRTALRNSGFSIPPSRITVNLSPANLRKQGNGFDLPIAVALLRAAGYLKEEETDGILFAGELSLDGSLKGIHGVLSLSSCAKENGLKKVMVPRENANEAAIIHGIDSYGVSSLKDMVERLKKKDMEEPVQIDGEELLKKRTDDSLDFSEMSGQEMVKRAAEVAAAGFHNLLYIGPPGSGKTMAAKRIPTILPALTLKESVELSKVYSIAGLLPEGEALIVKRPFRNPHHTMSAVALVGGGRIPKPGEISLAGKGVLFLDELPEFQRETLEILRQPLEERQVVISRVHGTYTYPADFQLVCAMNPCKCGYYPDRSKCRCTPAEIHRYLSRISKPLLDRIDICVETPRIEYRDLEEKRRGESSANIRIRVEQAMEIQKKRYEKESFLFNSQLKGAKIDEYCQLEKEGKKLMKQAFVRLELSARSYEKILKVARTIADLEGETQILSCHLAEAISYREVDLKYWGGNV